MKVEEAANSIKDTFETNNAITTICGKIYESIKGNSLYMDRIWNYDILFPTGDIRVLPSYPGHMVSSCGMYKRPGGYWTLGYKTKYGHMITAVNGFKRRVHRLVIETFRTQNPSPEQTHVNHINGKGHDNRFLNLEYATPSENVQHAYDMNLNSSRKSVIGTFINSGVSTTYVSMASAARQTKCYESGISQCCRGKIKTTNGYNWRFA